MTFLFYLTSSSILASALFVIRSKNPVHAVFHLVLVFIQASALLLLAGCEYFALAQLIVYVGALAVMFLFVVMLLDIPVTEIIAQSRGYFYIAGVFITTFVITVAVFAFSPFHNESVVWFSLPEDDIGYFSFRVGGNRDENLLFNWANKNTEIPQIGSLGKCMFTTHVDLLVVACLLLLVAMIGAVVLTLRKRVNIAAVDVFSQHNRDFSQIVYKIK